MSLFTSDSIFLWWHQVAFKVSWKSIYHMKSHVHFFNENDNEAKINKLHLYQWIKRGKQTLHNSIYLNFLIGVFNRTLSINDQKLILGRYRTMELVNHVFGISYK